nr:RNA-directed DNA polymerase, eukaryota, reverse transcriptase zinc-binding domain protein [Tanacetum cinerariifolium]
MYAARMTDNCKVDDAIEENDNGHQIVQEKLLTQDRILKWKPNEILECALCGKCSDSHEHLFFQCTYSAREWGKLQPMINRKAPELEGHMVAGFGYGVALSLVTTALLEDLKKRGAYSLWRVPTGNHWHILCTKEYKGQRRFRDKHGGGFWLWSSVIIGYYCLTGMRGPKVIFKAGSLLTRTSEDMSHDKTKGGFSSFSIGVDHAMNFNKDLLTCDNRSPAPLLSE